MALFRNSLLPLLYFRLLITELSVTRDVFYSFYPLARLHLQTRSSLVLEQICRRISCRVSVGYFWTWGFLRICSSQDCWTSFAGPKLVCWWILGTLPQGSQSDPSTGGWGCTNPWTTGWNVFLGLLFAWFEFLWLGIGTFPTGMQWFPLGEPQKTRFQEGTVRPTRNFPGLEQPTRGWRVDLRRVRTCRFPTVPCSLQQSWGWPRLGSGCNPWSASRSSSTLNPFQISRWIWPDVHLGF